MEKIFDRILFLMDGSSHAMTAAEFTIRLAAIHQSTVIAVNIIDPNIVNQLSRFQKDLSLGEVEVELEENGWKYLYYFEEMAADKRVKNFIHLERGNPADRLVTMAQKYDVDLIILPNSSEHGGTKGVMHTRFVEQIIDYVSCSVMVAPKR
ncbi:MAG: universal stress protein [Candidatus Delongbacteria bacterium]|nr:universal stress protein [Candidatus Delongbacteria bacterium]